MSGSMGPRGDRTQPDAAHLQSVGRENTDVTVPVPAAMTQPTGVNAGYLAGTSALGPDDPGRLGPYRLLQQLGEGGMGVVHLGLDPRGRAVAIKVLRDHVANDVQARARLAREVSSLSRVHHDAVAPVLDADVEGPRPYVVTRYVPGPPLDEWVRGHGPLSGPQLVTFAREMSNALAAIHAAGVVHRDVKPGNVLMHEGSPVLIDFGIAHLVDEARLTVSGLIMGTPGYLSPELLAGRPVCEATDWWGWAATLVYAATGRPPFGVGGMEAVVQRTLAGECDLRGVDPKLVPLLRAALDPEPDRRPERPVVLAALEAYAAGLDTTRSLTTASHAATSAHRLPHTAMLPAVAVPSKPVPPVSYAGFGAPARPAPAAAPHGIAPATTALPGPQPWPGPPMPSASPPQVSSPPDQAPGRAGDRHEGFLPTGPQGPGEPGLPATPRDPRIGRRRRTGTLAAVGLTLTALATVLPVAALLAAASWSALARTADRSLTAVTLRRMERGPRGRDVPLAVLTSPVHLVTGIASAVLTAILPMVLGIAGVFATAVLSASVRGVVPMPTHPLSLAGGMVVGLLTAWWGIGGTSLRRGSRSLVRAAAPGRGGAVVASVLLLAVAVYLAIGSQATGVQADWWPLPNTAVDGWVRLSATSRG